MARGREEEGKTRLGWERMAEKVDHAQPPCGKIVILSEGNPVVGFCLFVFNK